MPPGVAAWLLWHGIELALVLLFGYGCYRDGLRAGRATAEVDAKLRAERESGSPVPPCSKEHR